VDVWHNATTGAEVRMLVADGVLRMRWRNQTDRPGGESGKPLPLPAMVPGQAYLAQVDMWQACWVFAAGHRVGVDVTSSASPLYDVNPNTGEPLLNATGANVTATNTIFQGEGVSFLRLPVVTKADMPMYPGFL
jgi:uncharacterized protein